MTVSQEILENLKEELDSKIKQREGILDRLALADIEIDRYTKLIVEVDKEALGLVQQVNATIGPIKTAYDARLNAGCVTNLIWEQKKSWTGTSFAGGGQPTFTTFQTWKVVKNGGPPENGHGAGTGTYGYVPYQGLKYYKRPSNRDYGSNLVTQFTAYVSLGSTWVGISTVNFLDGIEPSIPSEIQIGDTLTDDLDNPQLFTTGDLPEVTGFGTTDVVGILTTLVGGISTGSNIFYHFGAGDNTLVQTGMVLLEPEVSGLGTSYVGIFTSSSFTEVTGFGTGTQIIEYYDSAGILTTTTLQVTTLTLSNPALIGLEEGDFRVGVVTTIPAVSISTVALGSSETSDMFVIRTQGDIDAGFDYTKNPNSPEKIGILNSSNLGIGHSLKYSANGDPNKQQTWKPETARPRISKYAPAIKEPFVGAGRAEYWVGTTQWPTLTKTTATVNPGTGLTSYFTSTTYASLGTQVTIGGTTNSVSIGYAGIGPNTPGNCSSYDSAISAAEASNNANESQYEPLARDAANKSKVLRDKRSEKEKYAWSLLQSAAKTREDIKLLREQISAIENTDWSKYEK
jgi:hypothetical protein